MQCVLYQKLSRDTQPEKINWQALCDQFGIQLVQAHDIDATVDAEEGNITQLLTMHPNIQATSIKTYHHA